MDTKQVEQGKHFFETLVFMIAVISSCYHVYAVTFGAVTPMIHRAWHLFFVISIGFLLSCISPKGDRRYVVSFNILLAILGIAVNLYLILNYDSIMDRTISPVFLDKVAFVVTAILILELGRRTLGWFMPLIGLIFLIYAFVGHILPYPFTHRGFDLDRVTSYLYFTMDGIFGAPIGASSTMVFMFILFGSFLLATGGGEFMNDLAMSLTGQMTGGPAKVSVIGSSLFGMISGSSVANVVVDGPITINLMKKVGYKAHMAAAIEATASTGGLIMPPVMGAGAFIMAELLGISYYSIAKAAILPALLYYITLFTIVHFEAKKEGLLGLPKEKLPKLKPVLIKYLHLIPAILILVLLVFSRYPVMWAAVWSILAIVCLSLLRKETRPSFSKILEAMAEGTKGIIQVAAACAIAGLIIGVVGLTGFQLKIGAGLVRLSGGSTFLLLVYTALLLIFLGMSLPAAASYLVGISVTGYALIHAGIPPLVAHMFVFFYSVLSNLTPPVAMAAYAAAGIAGADPIRTGVSACFMGSVAFILPFMFVYHQGLLLMGPVSELFLIVSSALIGGIALGIGVVGYLFHRTSWLERVLFFVGGIAMIHFNLLVTIFGFLMVLVGFVLQLQKQEPKRNFR